MTDNEIIKALECCVTDNQKCSCKDCPYNVVQGSCFDILNQEAVILINRQKAEIERLEEENLILSQKRINLFERIKIVNEARAAAIKETIEAIKKNSNSCVMEHDGITIERTRSFQISGVKLYEIEREMTGG